MHLILLQLWNDPIYFKRMMVALIAFSAALLPILPLGEMGGVGYWLGRIAGPFAITLATFVGDRGPSNQFTAAEIADIRAKLAIKP